MGRYRVRCWITREIPQKAAAVGAQFQREGCWVEHGIAKQEMLWVNAFQTASVPTSLSLELNAKVWCLPRSSVLNFITGWS